MKKIFTFILAFVATSCLWAYDFQSGDLYYNITSDTTVEVTYQYQWSSDNYAGLTPATIPETVTNNGTTYSVTSIGEEAFYYCSSLTSVTIGNSVTSIGEEAFSGCDALTSITIPNSVTSIGMFAFNGCLSLTSITIPNSVTRIGEAAFAGCVSLTSITIPNSVTSIGMFAFNGCYALTSVTIPNSVTSIGSNAFWCCSSLTSITIPNSVTSIGAGAFNGTAIYKDESNWKNDVLYIDNCLIVAKTSISGVYTIKENTRLIADNAFAGCSFLTSITIPNSVTGIGDYAFKDCSTLASITIPESVISIGYNTFAGCIFVKENFVNNSLLNAEENNNYWGAKFADIELDGLLIRNDTIIDCRGNVTSVTIPNSVTSIGDKAFNDCSVLASITIPESVISIGYNTFAGCIFVNGKFANNSSLNAEENNYWGAKFADIELDGLLIRNDTIIDCRGNVTSVTIPNSVTSIGDYAFNRCYALTSVTIPNSVTSIGEGAFANASLTSIVVPDNVTFIGMGAFCDMEETLKSAVIGSGVKELYATFVECSSLESVILSEGLETIGNEVFNGCNFLSSVNIPHSVTSIEESAFAGCLPLESIVIPSGVTTIGDYAFGFCISLTTVICKAIEVPELESNVFNRMPLSEATLYVPAESLEDYKAADQWKEFGTILPLDKAPSAVENTRLPITNSTKLLRNGQVYILQDGKTYTVTGQKL